MFIIAKPIHHSRLPANTFYKLDKYILQSGQMHFTIWEGGMIIISKANSSVAPPAGKEEFHHFFTRVALQSLLSQHCCSVLTNRNTKKSQRNTKNTQRNTFTGLLCRSFPANTAVPSFLKSLHWSFRQYTILYNFLTIICLALWGFY